MSNSKDLVPFKAGTPISASKLDGIRKLANRGVLAGFGGFASDFYSIRRANQEEAVVPPITLALVEEIIDAATLSDTTITPGESPGVKIFTYAEANDGTFTYDGVDGTLMNYSQTQLRGSVQYPVAVSVAQMTEDRWLILGAYDMSGLPGFNFGTKQIAAHDADEVNFQLVNFCYDVDYVFEVVADTANNKLVYRTPDKDTGTCDPVETKIIDLGPCT